MRIRSTKPEFWRSRRVASVSWDARLVLKALESYVDDNGVGKDDLALIVSDTFPRDLAREPSRTLARVSEAISELHEAGLLWRYGHEDRDLLYIANWENVQRVDKPQPGRNPRPDGTFNYKESSIRESSGTPREHSRSLAPGTGEQGNRGTGEQGKERVASGADADPPQSIEHRVTDAAYQRLGKGFNFIATRSIVKWAIHDKGSKPNDVHDSIISVYEMGKPITKQTIGQHLDGHLDRRASPDRQADVLRREMESAQADLLEIEQ